MDGFFRPKKCDGPWILLKPSFGDLFNLPPYRGFRLIGRGYFEAACPSRDIDWTKCHIDAAYIRCRHNGVWDEGWKFDPPWSS